MLRAAYFGQELLSTFSTAIGEIALIPATGGLFTVKLTHQTISKESGVAVVEEVLLWDRKSEGGFPETKVLKQRVRDVIQPERDLGHSDKNKHVAKGESTESETRATGKSSLVDAAPERQAPGEEKGGHCEDCQ